MAANHSWSEFLKAKNPRWAALDFSVLDICAARFSHGLHIAREARFDMFHIGAETSDVPVEHFELRGTTLVAAG
jgi:hypothetical protein